MVSIEEFKKLELIIAQIKDVQEHPQADRLYLIKVDTGKEEKQIVAGIRPFYRKEDLLGRKIVLLNNMEPAVIRGQESQGMLLAATDAAGTGISVLSPDRDVANSSIVK